MTRARSVLVLLGVLLTSQNARAGYTHYWTWLQKPDPAALQACVDEIRKVANARKDLLEITGGAVQKSPDAGSAVAFIMFNGVGEGAHEAFDFPGRPGFNFTKTAQKPYDEVVTAALLVARDHFPPDVLQIESDGEWREGAWSPGSALYTQVTGRPAQNPMEAPPPTDGEDATGAPRVKDKRWFFVLALGLLALILLKSLG